MPAGAGGCDGIARGAAVSGRELCQGATTPPRWAPTVPRSGLWRCRHQAASQQPLPHAYCRLPVVLALGYTAACTASLATSVSGAGAVPALAGILLAAPPDHVCAAAVWTVGQIGRHSAASARTVAEAGGSEACALLPGCMQAPAGSSFWAACTATHPSLSAAICVLGCRHHSQDCQARVRSHQQ